MGYGNTFPKTVRSAAQLSPGRHFVIFEEYTDSEYTPPYHVRDKEGSYSSVQKLRIEEFETQDAWEKEIQKRTSAPSYGQAKFAAAIVDVPRIEVKVNVDVKVGG